MPLPTKTDLSTLILPGVKPVQHFKIACMFQEEYDALPDEFKPYYEYNEETRQYTLNELEWLKWRKHGPYHRHPEDARYIPYTLGGSDIAVLFDGSDLSRELFLYDGQHGSNFKCRMELFHEKTGRKLELEEKKDTDVLWTGHNEEPSIRALFKKRYCDEHPTDIVKVINDCHMYQCGMRDKYGKLLYPFVLCDLDGLVEINGVMGVLECKTCNKGSEDFKLWKQRIVPLKYYLQVCWYMLCMNLPYAYICAKWGLSPSECCYIYIERDFEVEKAILEMAQEFLQSVRDNILPDTNGQNMDHIFIYWRRKMGNPKPETPTVRLDRSYRDTISHLSVLQDEIKAMNINAEDLRKQRNMILSNEIFPLMGDSSEAVVDYSPTSNLRIILKNKNAASRKIVDSESLRAYDSKLYEKFVKPVFDDHLFIEEMENNPDVSEFIVEDRTLTDAKLNYCDIRLEPKIRPERHI